MRKAIIIGSNGQDGKLLFAYLKKKKYNIVGIDKKSIITNGSGWKKNIDITDKNQVFNLVKKFIPDEIYYLAAFHHSSQDKKIDNLVLIAESYKINVLAFGYFLEAVRSHSPLSRIFYASSCLVFGETNFKKQTELTPYNPDTIYGITKFDGMLLGRMYRKKFGLFVSSGIFYNHESFYREEKFVSKKIIATAVNIKNGLKKELVVGDLEATIDWGYAPDFVEAVYKILQVKNPDEFIISSGEKHTVKEFVEKTFGQLKLDWKKYVREDRSILTRRRVILFGDNRKIKKIIKWQPKTGFEKMIKLMVAQELKFKNGK